MNEFDNDDVLYYTKIGLDLKDTQLMIVVVVVVVVVVIYSCTIENDNKIYIVSF